MKAQYEHVAVFSLSGGVTTLRDGVATLLESCGAAVRLTRSISDAVRCVARSTAIPNHLFRVGLPKDTESLEAMTSGDLAELEQANKGTFLVCFHRGEVEFSTSKVARTYETVDGSVDVVEVERGVRSEVAGLHAHENALVVSVVCAELEGTARRVFEGSSFHVESKEIVPLHFSVGSAGVRVCSPLTEAHLERLRLVLQSAIAEQEPVPVAELFLEAMQEQHGLVPFFLAWTATERLVHYVFRRRGLTAEAEPVRPQVPLNARAKKVVEAIVPAGDRDRVLATFKGLKKNRDDLFHRGGRTSDHYPTDEACQFLSEVLRCHLGCDPPSTPKCSN